MKDIKISTESAEKVLCNSEMLVLKWSLDGQISCANDMIKFTLGYEDLEERNIKDIICINDHNTLRSVVDLLHHSRFMEMELETKTRGGQILRIYWSSFLTYHEEEDKMYVFSIGHHQDSDKEPMDYLTVLNNRQVFENYVVKLLTQNKAFYVYLLDVDDFNIINELHGYSFGDYYIRCLVENIMAYDNVRVFRGSGDQLIVIEVMTHETNADKTVALLQDIVAKTLNHNALSHELTACIGVLESPLHGFDLHSIEQNIDIALNEAQSRGKNHVVVYDDMYKKEIRAKRGIEFGIDKALAADEFELYCQPIIDMKDVSCTKYEVLLRWPEGQKRGFYIGQVIDVSEQSGQIIDLDRYVINKVFSTIKRYGLNQTFSINISTQSFYSDDFINYLEVMMYKHMIDPTRIELEITEYTTIQDYDKTKLYMDRIKNLGFKILLDDFGTDYSSLNYLSKLPFDGLKIDKSYVDYIASENSDYVIVKHLIALANELGLKTIAEGIEYDEQRAVLRELGCQFGQGYLFSKPHSIDHIIVEVK